MLGGRKDRAVNATTGRFTCGKHPVLIVQQAGWALGPVWTGTENLAHTGVRTPDRPALSGSLIDYDILVSEFEWAQ